MNNYRKRGINLQVVPKSIPTDTRQVYYAMTSCFFFQL